MGMPPVVVGLIVYLLLSRSGPLGVFGLLFSPIAMILAQIVIVTPIIAALTRQLVEDLGASIASSCSRSAAARAAPSRPCSGTGASAS